MGQENNRKKYATEDFVEAMQVFSDIASVSVKENADGSRTVTLKTKDGTTQDISVPKGKALLIEDSQSRDTLTNAKDQYVVKQDAKSGSAEKVEYGGLTTRYNAPPLSDVAKQYIVRALKELDSIDYSDDKKTEWEAKLENLKTELNIKSDNIVKVEIIDASTENQEAKNLDDLGIEILTVYDDNNSKENLFMNIKQNLYIKRVLRLFIEVIVVTNKERDWVSEIGNSFKVGDMFFVEYIKNALKNNKSDREIISGLKKSFEVSIKLNYEEKF